MTRKRSENGRQRSKFEKTPFRNKREINACSAKKDGKQTNKRINMKVKTLVCIPTPFFFYQRSVLTTPTTQIMLLLQSTPGVRFKLNIYPCSPIVSQVPSFTGSRPAFRMLSFWSFEHTVPHEPLWPLSFLPPPPLSPSRNNRCLQATCHFDACNEVDRTSLIQ